MKRIYLSLLMIFATLISVVGLTYAYFSSTAVTMTGITLATGTPVLKISDNFTGPAGSWDNPATTITGNSFSNIIPGRQSATQTFYLRNGSDGISLAAIIPTISTSTGDWTTLKDSIQVQFVGDAFGTPNPTAWKTLAEWQANTSTSLISNPMVPGNVSTVTIQYQMPSSVNDSTGALQGKTISGLQWNFVGRTQ